MKNIKIIAALSLALFISSMAFGQETKTKRPSREKVKAMKIGYITDKLSLTTEEAQKFWPVYNEYEAKMDGMRKKRKEAHKNIKSGTELSDAEVEKMVDGHIIAEQKELDIKKEYHIKFKTVLPIKKVAKLYRANESFKRDLLKKIRDHKGGGKGEHKGPPQGGRH
jgi:Spy/CpxP family protein refolding chaperone